VVHGQSGQYNETYHQQYIACVSDETRVAVLSQTPYDIAEEPDHEEDGRGIEADVKDAGGMFGDGSPERHGENETALENDMGQGDAAELQEEELLVLNFKKGIIDQQEQKNGSADDFRAKYLKYSQNHVSLPSFQV